MQVICVYPSQSIIIILTTTISIKFHELETNNIHCIVVINKIKAVLYALIGIDT